MSRDYTPGAGRDLPADLVLPLCEHEEDGRACLEPQAPTCQIGVLVCSAGHVDRSYSPDRHSAEPRYWDAWAAIEAAERRPAVHARAKR